VNPAPRNLLNTGWTLSLILAILISCAVFLRFSDLSAPLLDFHPTRQLFGAIKARGIYYQSLPDAPAWKKDLAIRQYAGEATIEPPLLENLTALLYKTYGEQTAIPRAISASFWLIGGVFLFLLSKNLSGSALAATFSLAFYLLMPYAVTASRAFQPEPLMILLLLIFWWSVDQWARQVERENDSSTWRWVVISGIAGGLAIFVKFTAVFFVTGAALGAILAHIGLVRSIKLPQTWLLILLGIIPPVAYLIYGTYFGGFLSQQFGGRFYPEMWASPFFYLRWFLKLENVANIFWIVLGLLGCFVLSAKPVKIFLASLWIAYLLLGLTFAHHISSHDYYSLPIIPITAISLAPLLGMLLPLLIEKLQASRSLQITSLLLILAAFVLQSIGQYIHQRENDQRGQAALWAQVGDAIGHQPGVLALTTHYGYPLAYYGWQNSSPWPSSLEIKHYEETLYELAFNKDYFLITDFDEYVRQPELQKLLNEKYPILAQTRNFIIFDLAHPK